jgi:hypothetical protein
MQVHFNGSHNDTEKVGATVTPQGCVWLVRGSKFCRGTGYPDYGFCGFINFRQAIAGIIPRLGHDWFLSSPSDSFLNCPTVGRHIV